MFEKYLIDYYKSKISVKEICEKEGCVPTTFNRWLKNNGYLPRQNWLKLIDTGNEELNKNLKDRYSSMVNRCKGGYTDHYGHYNGKEYVTVYEWVEYCNANKVRLLRLWDAYITNSRSRKYSVSVDRINDEHGYLVENMQFVTHGFNSWKRNVTPLKVEHNGVANYFMTREEASRYYGLRKQTIGEILSGMPYHMKGYDVSESNSDDVMKAKKVKTLEEYYENFIA